MTDGSLLLESWSSVAKDILRQRVRVLQLLHAAERVGVTPVQGSRLHAFAYLADVLSPVWNLQPFDGKILKIQGGPHYPDFQRELDRLVVLGLLLVSSLRYVSRTALGPLMDGSYSINFESPSLSRILEALGAGTDQQVIDPRDFHIQRFLVDLAGALATLTDDQIEAAATVDATYADERIDFSNVLDFGAWSTDAYRDNLSFAVAERFHKFLPERAQLSAGEKLYLYASFLGRRASGA